jgi:prepilin-type N-terminal cleavage/methylation domain-containing protein/prepilin-type processing-associated H-X9-DG protein
MSAPRLCPNRRSAPAFTLIEILVVVAIIALLVAILLPSLARARENAKATICGTNGHQMGLALQMYTNVYKYTPGHHRVDVSVTPTEWIVFPVRLLRATSSSGKRQSQHMIFSCPSSKVPERWDGVKRVAPGQVNGGLATDFNTFDYGINDWGTDMGAPFNLGLGGHIFDPANATVNYPWHSRDKGEVPVDRIKRPGRLIAFADNNADDKGYGNWDTALDPTNPLENVGNRHTDRCMVVFADGHANLQYQKKLNDLAKNPGVRYMWNNDEKPH